MMSRLEILCVRLINIMRTRDFCITFGIRSRKRHMPEQDAFQLYIPLICIDTVLNNCYDHVLAAHFGFQRTYSGIRQRYFLTGMYRDIDNWVRSCISCSQRKTHRHEVLTPFVTMKVPGPFARVSVDILGPLPIKSSGNIIICTVFYRPLC